LKILKFNPNAIIFLSSLVFIPLTYQLIINFHTGGIDLFKEFIISAFFPKITNEILITIIKRLNETIIISLISWTISIILGVLFGILSSDLFYKIIDLPKYLKKLIKLILTIIRSIHEMIWCLI